MEAVQGQSSEGGGGGGGGRWVIVFEGDDGPATALDLDRALWRAALLAEDPHHIVLAMPGADAPALLPVLGTWPTVRKVAPPPGGGSLPAVMAGLALILEADPAATIVVLPSALGDGADRPAEGHLPDDCAACGPLLRAAAGLDQQPAALVTLALQLAGGPSDALLATGAFVAHGRTLAARLRAAAPGWWSVVAAGAAGATAPHGLAPARIAEVIATTPPEMLGVVVIPAEASEPSRLPPEAPLAPLLEIR